MAAEANDKQNAIHQESILKLEIFKFFKLQNANYIMLMIFLLIPRVKINYLIKLLSEMMHLL